MTNEAAMFVDGNLDRLFCTKQNLDKALNSLDGLLAGVLADGEISEEEVGAIGYWLDLHQDFLNHHPFVEFVEPLDKALRDRTVDVESLEDIRWVCKQFREGHSYYDAVTADLQVLHSLMQGVLADGVITKEELVTVRDWLDAHAGLTRTWPYDELCSIVTAVLTDGVIDDDEHRLLKRFFWEFIETKSKKVIQNPPADICGKLQGVCAMCPEIEFEGQTFCFTGKSSRTKRSELKKIVEQAGGDFTNSMSRKVDYLVIGDDGNPNWAFSCYGRKVEAAVEQRKAGGTILLVHENDFWDSVVDRG